MREAPPDPLEAWRILSNTWKRWYRLAEKNLESLGLSVTEFRVLNRLQVDGPSPMVRLARDQGLTRSSITGVVDGLEAQGLVRRVRSREDRRVITIQICRRGRELRQKALAAHQAFVRQTLAALSSSEAASLVVLFRKVAESLERPATRARAAARPAVPPGREEEPGDGHIHGTARHAARRRKRERTLPAHAFG